MSLSTIKNSALAIAVAMLLAASSIDAQTDVVHTAVPISAPINSPGGLSTAQPSGQPLPTPNSIPIGNNPNPNGVPVFNPNNPNPVLNPNAAFQPFQPGVNQPVNNFQPGQPIQTNQPGLPPSNLVNQPIQGFDPVTGLPMQTEPGPNNPAPGLPVQGQPQPQPQAQPLPGAVDPSTGLPIQPQIDPLLTVGSPQPITPPQPQPPSNPNLSTPVITSPVFDATTNTLACPNHLQGCVVDGQILCIDQNLLVCYDNLLCPVEIPDVCVMKNGNTPQCYNKQALVCRDGELIPIADAQ